MDVSEKRIIGSLLLLAGLTFLSIALYTNQLPEIVKLMTEIFKPALAGIP